MTKQRTIKNTITVEGTGLQTGGKVTLVLKSSPADSGINFIRVDLPNRPLLNIQSIDMSDAGGLERRTTLGLGDLQIQTTEHLLAALSGLAVDNIVAEMNSAELPALDGSARGFADALKKAGIVEQDAAKNVLEVKEPVWCNDRDALIVVLPDDDFRISYTLSYPGVGTQFFTTTVNENDFEAQIAPARTFCSGTEALELLKKGLGKGANYENTLVMGKNGPIKNTLRFPDEPVRHKVLDLIGDLYLLGLRIRAHVIGIKSGHRLNVELVKRLKKIPRER